MDELPERQDIAQRISEEILRIYKESWGRGARSVTTYVEDDAVVCFLDDVELLPHEQLLVSQGDEMSVIEGRKSFQKAVSGEFRSAVEEATGQRVTGFFSETVIEPNGSVEVFRLAPKVAKPGVRPGESPERIRAA